MRNIILTSFVLLAVATSCRAEKSEMYTIPAFPQSCSMSVYGEICLHAFGNNMTHVPLTVPFEKECDNVSVQLYQLSTRLSAPVGKPVILAKHHCDSVTMFLPKVKEPTVFRITYINNTQSITEAQGTLMEVYPSNLWENLKEWSDKNQLIVNDRGGKLTALLDREHIKYSSIMLPDNNHMKQVCIWVPVGETIDALPFNCNSMLVLHEKSEELPSIHTLDIPEQTRIDVHMPLLDALSTHPLAQKTFVELIHSTLKGE